MTKVLITNELEATYNADPASGRIFIQLSGMWMAM